MKKIIRKISRLFGNKNQRRDAIYTYQKLDSLLPEHILHAMDTLKSDNTGGGTQTLQIPHMHTIILIKTHRT